MSRIAVVGGGVGALAAAVRLSCTGHEVDLYERNGRAGGKLDGFTRNGFHFDTGPSLLTWPEELCALFDMAKRNIDDFVTLRRLDQPFRYIFPDGTTLLTHDDAGATAASVRRLTGSNDEWDSFVHHSAKIWEVSERTFFAGPMSSPGSLIRRMHSPLDFLAIDPARTLASRSQKTFADERMQMWLNRYATYSGSSPWKAPATLACIPFLEQDRGCWHVEGGLANLATALVQLAESVGVRVHTSADVNRIVSKHGVVTAVVVNGERVGCDAVIADIDSRVLYEQLIPDAKAMKRVRRAEPSTSGFAMMLSLSDKTPDLSHHNVWFSSDQRREFEQIFDSSIGVADEPTIYVCCSAVTDASQAPEGSENWFVLVNTAANAKTDWTRYGDAIVSRLGISERILESSFRTPSDIESDYNAPGGAIYGTSSNGSRSAFVRAANRAPIRGLYVCGGSAHPGGGLPLVMRSGAIAAALVMEDLNT